MSGVAISPYNSIWFVGTDMGTLFRSVDRGVHWIPVDHYEAEFDAHLPYAVSPGFGADGKTVFHAKAGSNPKRSLDGGVVFESMNMGLQSSERIVYWKEDSKNENVIFAGTTNGLLVSKDKGASWTRTAAPSGEAKGTYIDHSGSSTVVYHANSDRISVSNDLGSSFTTFHNPSAHNIRNFTGGRSASGVTFAYGDDNGAGACSWANAYSSSWGAASVSATQAACGYVWVKKNSSDFANSGQTVGDHLKMAENDSQTIWTTGSKDWLRQYGTVVHVSEDAGSSWTLKLNQMDYDAGYKPWPMDKIEYSAVALDIGWWDSGYESFAINNLNSSEVGGTGWFFFHTSVNKGDYWDAPFTEFKDTGLPAKGKKWQTQGVEVMTVYRLKFHPNNKNLMYVANADIGGLVSDDGGESFRVIQALYNSNYDYAFDPDDQQVVYAANGADHDYPVNWHANAVKSQGGIFKSTNQGLSWTRLTPSSSAWDRQFLSVGYDSQRNTLYGGSHGDGIARSTDGGQTWAWFNSGLPSSAKIIPRIIIDPDNGNAYALLAGDAPNFTNATQTGIYLLDVANGSSTWQLLRGNVTRPAGAMAGYELWYYPTDFDIDFSDPQRRTMWLTDYENNRNWLMSGAWKTTDGGQNWERKIQLTHPVGIHIDPSNPDHIFTAGGHYLDGSWGNGGQVFTTDGGATWSLNRTPTLQRNARNAFVDPVNPNNIYYSYLGGGILKGPNPARQPASVETDPVN